MISGPRILLLEDDPAIAGTVAFALQREGLGVDHVLLVGAARAAAAAALPALAILDVGLPDGNGLDLCREWRPKRPRAKLRAVRPDVEPIATHRGMGYSLDLSR